MTDTPDLHEKMSLATSPEIWAEGGPVKDWTTDYDIRDKDYVENPSDLGRNAREVLVATPIVSVGRGTRPASTTCVRWPR